MFELLRLRLVSHWNMLAGESATSACAESLVQVHSSATLSLVCHVVVVEMLMILLGLFLGKLSEGHEVGCLETRLESMAVEHSAERVQDLAIEAFVGQVEDHIGSIVAPQQRFAPGDCSRSQFRQYRRRHIELQYHHQVVRQVLLLGFLVEGESL
jgi:hypothetical protein